MLDGTNNPGGYSPASVFVKQYPIAKPKFPLSGSQLTETPVFSWTAADGVTPYVFGAATYELQVSLYPNFSQLVDSVVTHQTSFTPMKKYPNADKLYWQVRIKDKYGVWGPYTNALLTLDDKPFSAYLPTVRK